MQTFSNAFCIILIPFYFSYKYTTSHPWDCKKRKNSLKRLIETFLTKTKTPSPTSFIQLLWRHWGKKIESALILFYLRHCKKSVEKTLWFRRMMSLLLNKENHTFNLIICMYDVIILTIFFEKLFWTILWKNHKKIWLKSPLYDLKILMFADGSSLNINQYYKHYDIIIINSVNWKWDRILNLKQKRNRI